MNETNFHMKGFTLGLTLKQRQKATQKSPIDCLELLRNHATLLHKKSCTHNIFYEQYVHLQMHY